MKLDNFLPVSRKLQTHWIYKDSSYLHCWLEMLFNARFSNEPKTDIYKGVLYTINRGEFIYSRPTYSARLGISEGKLRTLIKLLVAENMIEEIKSLGNNKPTIYKIINYNSYNIQPSERVYFEGVEEHSNQVTTKSQPSDNQVTTKSQPLKNIDNKDDIENNDNKKNNSRFTPPTLEEVKAYCIERNNNVDPVKWFNYYESNGWKVGKNKMSKWKSAVITWEKGSGGNAKGTTSATVGNKSTNTRQLEEWEIQQIELTKRLKAEGKLVDEQVDF